jgi:FtsP/CotA-like multicopper oxidase with cupredoxin domain
MRKILFVSGCSLVLFFANAFTSNDHSAFSYNPSFAKKDILSCGLPNESNIKAGASKFITNETDESEEISINDNRQAAGEMRDGVLYLKLETRTGSWYPETHDGDPLHVYAFAEKGKSLQLPGPLIRVTEGTVINAEIHNTIPGSPLVLHGFYSRPGNEKDSISIAFNETYKVQFKAGKAGTYFYWASDGNIKTWFNNLPFIEDSQLFGAFIVDPPNTIPDPQERIFMIGLWNDTTKTGEYTNDREELAINGLTWPYTERLIYPKDEAVHWRVINASNQDHPMHLHGFYYTVNSRGDEEADTIYKEQDRYLSVTELLKPHQTISMTWTPDREGNWLFHCHTLFHLMAGSFLQKSTRDDGRTNE